jgi:hypothetical protein
VFGHNTRATRVYMAAWFEREGLLRRAAFVSGEWVDLAIMAVLRPAREQYRSEGAVGSTAADAALAAAMPLVSA